ncbi:MAG: DUF89 family protein [Candidatus Schekmanbacteria bacterium]|nr:MAG: DUF89 family protein [Candidatus Schekmanbacteria bacterium]
MKVKPMCLQCMKELIRKTCMLASTDRKIQKKAEENALKILYEKFNSEAVPAKISSIFHKEIKKITSNDDPYEEYKREEIKNARMLFEIVKEKFPNNFYGAVAISVLGNSIDYFRDIEDVRKDIDEGFSFAIDDTIEVEILLKKKVLNSKEILFLADNSGEYFFDIPLIKSIEKMNLKVFYSIKSEAVQNDLCFVDYQNFIKGNESISILPSGNGTVGISLEESSDEFLNVFKRAGLIISKGMGNYETLTEIKYERPVFYLLKAKCIPVADSLGVKKGDYVAKLTYCR